MNECYDSLLRSQNPDFRSKSPFCKARGGGDGGRGRPWRRPGGGVSDNDNVVICEPAVPNPTFVEDKIAATRAYEPHPARVAAGRATMPKKADRLRALRERLQRAREANERKKESLRRASTANEEDERKKEDVTEGATARETKKKKGRKKERGLGGRNSAVRASAGSRRERVGHSRTKTCRTHAAANVATDLNCPTEPKGFPNGLTAEEKEWICKMGLGCALAMTD